MSAKPAFNPIPADNAAICPPANRSAKMPKRAYYTQPKRLSDDPTDHYDVIPIRKMQLESQSLMLSITAWISVAEVAVPPSQLNWIQLTISRVGELGSQVPVPTTVTLRPVARAVMIAATS